MTISKIDIRLCKPLSNAWLKTLIPGRSFQGLQNVSIENNHLKLILRSLNARARK